MIFNVDEVNLPERLLQALISNRLVIFVGAGVSTRAYPEQPTDTFYPDFPGLTREVASRLHREISGQEEKYLREGFIDRVLGEWDDETGTVKRHAAEVLTINEGGQRIDLHRKILGLFAGSLTPRIVTTNFDRLLFRACYAEGLSGDPRWRSYTAPALPPAARFNGVCYLHGVVNEPSELVLTDKDIGRAYMDEGWALRFAHAMFQRFDVLFIGYSLEDPPLRYLSLALEGTSAQGRWALLPEPTDPEKKTEVGRNWTRRNVEPIWYPVKDRDYRALERTLGDWAADNVRSFLDRRAVLADIGSDKPNNLRPHELSRAQYFLRDPASLRDFAKNSLDAEWFNRLLEWNHFDFLLKGLGPSTDGDGALVERLIDWLVADHVDLIAKLTGFRETIHPAVFERFCRRVEEGKATGLSSPTLVKIIEFFRPTLERARPSHFTLKRILIQLLDNEHEDYAIWLFTTLLRTKNDITKQPSFEREYARLSGGDVSDIPEFNLRFELHLLEQFSDRQSKQLFEDVFRPRILSVGVKLIHALMQSLLETRAFGTLRDSLRSDWERSAIEEHPQDQYKHGPMHLVLDMLRDSWEALLAADRATAKAVCSTWQHINDGIVRRLHIHAVRLLLETSSE